MTDQIDNYNVGYKRPPKNGQFQKGQSGNPKGRPKRSKNIAKLYQELLEEEIQIKEAGQSKTITAQEAIARRVRADAIKGKDKAIDRILQHAPQNEDEEVRLTQAEWVETLNFDGLTIEDCDFLINLLENMGRTN